MTLRLRLPAALLIPLFVVVVLGHAGGESFGGVAAAAPSIASSSPAASSPAEAEGAEQAPLEIDARLGAPDGVTSVRLANGATVIIKPIQAAPVVAVRAYVHAGSLYEGQWLGCGLSHLLEHLVAGDEDAPADANSASKAKRTAARIGGQSNAYTSQDHTCYYIAASASKADDCIDYIAGMLAAPSFTKDDFEREHGVVQRERELRRDEPLRLMSDIQNGIIFRSHPAAVPVIGFQKPLADLTWDDVLRYHAKMYVGQNVVFVVAGDVDADKTLDRCRKSLAGLKAGRQPDLALPEVQPLAGVSRARLSNVEVKETTETISFISIPLLSDDLYALDLLSTVLVEGQASRLNDKVKRKMNLVTSVGGASWTPNWGKGEFSIDFSTSPNKADAAEKAILDEIRALLGGGVKDEELTRAKRIKLAELVYSQQTAEQQAAMLGTDCLTTGDMEFSRQYTRKIQSVSAEEVLAAARKYLTLDAMAITRMDPAGAEAAAGGPASASAPATLPASGPASREGSPPPKPKLRGMMGTLPNGLRVVLNSDPSVHVVSMVMATEGGLLLETPATNGMGAMMAMLSTRGAGARSAEEMDEFFDRAGGAVSAICGNNAFMWNATVLDDSFDQALDVFSDIVQKPTFPAKELELYRPDLLDQIARSREDLVGEAMIFARRRFFAGEPYGLNPLGDANVVKSATAGQIERFHREHVKAGASVLAIYGNFDMAAASAKVDKLFGQMPGGASGIAAAKFRSGPAGDSLAVEATKKQGAAVVFLQPGMIAQNLADRLPLDVLDTIISGYRMPGGWLHNELRGKRLVYVVHAYNWTGLAPGAFTTYAACEPDKAPQVVEIIRKNLDKAATYKPTRQEIEEAVNTIITADILGNQEMKDLATSAALNELYGLGFDFLRRLDAEYRKVTPEDVERVARKYFGKGYSVLVTTPRPEAFKNAATSPAK
jgi:zinc protease